MRCCNNDASFQEIYMFSQCFPEDGMACYQLQRRYLEHFGHEFGVGVSAKNELEGNVMVCRSGRRKPDMVETRTANSQQSTPR